MRIARHSLSFPSLCYKEPNWEARRQTVQEGEKGKGKDEEVKRTNPSTPHPFVMKRQIERKGRQTAREKRAGREERGRARKG